MIATSFNRYQICLQSSKIYFYEIFTRTMFDIASIFGPYCKRLQAYIVSFGFEIASKFSPFCDLDCKHIRPKSLFSLRAYLVSFILIIETICGASFYMIYTQWTKRTLVPASFPPYWIRTILRVQLFEALCMIQSS